jgi:hypothetical protein
MLRVLHQHQNIQNVVGRLCHTNDENIKQQNKSGLLRQKP